MKTTINRNNLDHQAIYKLFPMVFSIGISGDVATVEHDEPLIFPSDEQVKNALLEQKWDLIRQQREPLLAEADIFVNRAEDAGNDVAAARAYRQALRDVTKQADPENVTWPTKP